MHYIVTLVERDFLYGASALYNSLIANSFSGIFVIGFRELATLPASAKQALEINTVNIEWHKLETKLHFANYKPQFMQQVLDLHADCTKITYIDPDIVLSCPFQWIDSWADGGPAVCGDVNWWMPATHPTRRQWLATTGLIPYHKLDLYFNSGFVSVRRDHRAFLDLWTELIERWGNSDNPLDGKGDIGSWRKGGRWLSFMSPNQDTLNIALMCWKGTITTLGPDVMGFSGFGVLPHAVGSGKPWRKNYILEALKGIPPRQVDKVFWRHASKPVNPYHGVFVFFRRLSISIASIISRVYKQN